MTGTTTSLVQARVSRQSDTVLVDARDIADEWFEEITETEVQQIKRWLHALGLTPPGNKRNVFLLDDLLFNGTLLCKVAHMVTSSGMRLTRRELPHSTVKSITQARNNVRTALRALAASSSATLIPSPFLNCVESILRVRGPLL